jgi:RNA polymerase sigma factor (sigma-70 family)
VTSEPGVEDLLRELAPQVLGALVRRFGRFAACEDATQEALLAASVEWRDGRVPDNPRGWLITVASRRVVDEFRSQESRRRREHAVAALEPDDRRVAPPADSETQTGSDDALTLLYLCCHPALTESSQIALTLRAVGGLTTAEIAQAFLVPERTLGQRIGRAKQRIAEAGGTFELPPPEERGERLRSVLHVLYLIFNEGYTASSGPDLLRSDLAAEAIRLTRQLHAILPADGEVAGLLALMLLTDARRPARTGADGSLIPLAEQDRARWSSDQIREGIALVTGALSTAALGTYQLQAAIAALHDEAPSAEDTDWPQILALYELLDRMDPSPVVTLNRAVAVAMVRGPEAGLKVLATLDGDERMTTYHRVHAVRAHLLELVGDPKAAHAAYREAARRTTSAPEQRYLEGRAARLA